MTENAKQLHNSNDEVMWRMRALKHTARSLAAKAKELERMAKADANIPAMDKASLEQVLRRIDNVMEWRFVDVLGEVQLDADILTQSIDFEPCEPCASASSRLSWITSKRKVRLKKSSIAAKSRKGDPCSLYLNTSSRLWIPTPHLDCIAMT